MNEEVAVYGKKAVVMYQASHPGTTILDWYSDDDNPCSIHIITSTHEAHVIYDPDKKEIIIVNDAKNKNAPPSGMMAGLLGMLLTVAYAVYIINHFSSVGNTIGGYIATSIVAPHIICVVVAACFSLIGYLAHKRWAMLTAGILMAVSAAVFPTYAVMVVVQAVLCFVSYARMRS